MDVFGLALLWTFFAKKYLKPKPLANSEAQTSHPRQFLRPCFDGQFSSIFHCCCDQKQSAVCKFQSVWFQDFKHILHTRRLFLQLSEAQSTVLRQRRPPPKTAARWCCIPPIKKLTAHYNSQCVVSALILFYSEALRRL